MIKLTVQGASYEFDQEHLLLAEAREMKTLTGLTPPKWGAGIEEGDADAVAVLIYLAKKRAGETLRFSDLDSIDYADIEMELVGEEPEAPVQESAATVGPTEPPPTSGMTQTDGTGDTSEPSPTTSSTALPTSTP